MKMNLWTTEPMARPENIIQGATYRFTLLTPCLVRMEYQENGQFVDLPTQAVWNRRFEVVPHRIVRIGDGFEIITDRMHLTYDGHRFTENGLSVKTFGSLHQNASTWHFGEHGQNLKGTARTLDGADGACELEDGIQSLSGCSVLDDSNSLLLNKDGWIEPRKGTGIDLYLFTYGRSYKEALRDYYRLTGNTPMLPRFALGNWWSRYYAYSEESYMELIRRFQAEEIPFSVAVIDMDWHLVEDVDPKYGNGWTGYTWNRKLFPDPDRFLNWLHEQGLHTTLNLHPADGIRAYEEAYPRLAQTLGTIDTEQEAAIPFDFTNPDFWTAYFDCVLHPEEDRGVDFWWIDWQQGNTTNLPGLDPLWMLNHYHYLDNARNGRRPLAFSRYAGPGSHRYPVGFSGDTLMTWESLQFQPFFTATASNIGYGWWSHDIGGHTCGYKDNEMAARWVQLGVFSPINRLHSSSSEFNGKEPWRYPMEIQAVMTDFLRLRHSLLPWLYTMTHRAYAENLPLVLPMYYDYPVDSAAYEVQNQYLFGDAFLVAPVTTPQIRGIDRGKVHAWLPEGLYIDFFTGLLYEGNREIDLYRDIHSIPVLAKAGAIIPMTEAFSPADENPTSLCIHVYAGCDGSFILYEDDNETMEYQNGTCVTTEMRLDWAEKTFYIEPPTGQTNLIPIKRTYTICFYGVEDSDVIAFCGDSIFTSQGSDPSSFDGEVSKRGGLQAQYDTKHGCLKVTLPEQPVDQEVRVYLCHGAIRQNDVVGETFRLLNEAEIPFRDKERIFSLVKKDTSTAAKVAELCSLGLDADLTGAVLEILTAREKGIFYSK